MDPRISDPLGRCLIDEYCNNDVLSLIFQCVGGFDLLSTVPFVCTRWRKVAKTSPLKFKHIAGWSWAFSSEKENNALFATTPLDINVIASCKDKHIITQYSFENIKKRLETLIDKVYWYSPAGCYVLGTLFLSDHCPDKYFFVLEYETLNREITIHTDLSELLTHGTSKHMKNLMKVSYFDKLKKKTTQRRRKKYKSYRQKK